MKDTLLDMIATAQAHEKWAMSIEATADEAATSVVFATQIRAWVAVLSPPSADAVDTHAASDAKLSTREK